MAGFGIDCKNKKYSNICGLTPVEEEGSAQPRITPVASPFSGKRLYFSQDILRGPFAKYVLNPSADLVISKVTSDFQSRAKLDNWKLWLLDGRSESGEFQDNTVIPMASAVKVVARVSTAAFTNKAKKEFLLDGAKLLFKIYKEQSSRLAQSGISVKEIKRLADNITRLRTVMESIRPTSGPFNKNIAREIIDTARDSIQILGQLKHGNTSNAIELLESVLNSVITLLTPGKKFVQAQLTRSSAEGLAYPRGFINGLISRMNNIRQENLSNSGVREAVDLLDRFFLKEKDFANLRERRPFHAALEIATESIDFAIRSPKNIPQANIKRLQELRRWLYGVRHQ